MSLFDMDFGGQYDADKAIEATHLDAALAYADYLLLEMFPDSATVEGLLANFERVYDIVPSSTATLAQRRQAALAAIRAKGGLTKSHFETMAQGLGYTIGLPAVGDPHCRIVEGEFGPFRADYGQADVDEVYDQGTGASMYTWRVLGTDVETDTTLQTIFEALKTAGTEVVFANE